MLRINMPLSLIGVAYASSQPRLRCDVAQLPVSTTDSPVVVTRLQGVKRAMFRISQNPAILAPTDEDPALLKA